MGMERMSRRGPQLESQMALVTAGRMGITKACFCLETEG